ncbi:MAG: hypothetical protein ABI606_12630 [Rhodoferax sp.]
MYIGRYDSFKKVLDLHWKLSLGAGKAGRPSTRNDDPRRGYSVSYVRKGSFGLRVRGESYELVAGSVLVGYPGDKFICIHDHHVCGDECLAFPCRRVFVDLIGGDTGTWRTGCMPPPILVSPWVRQALARPSRPLTSP